MKVWVAYHGKYFCYSRGLLLAAMTPPKETHHGSKVTYRLMELVPITKRGRRR